jgi:hypothetical protein
MELEVMMQHITNLRVTRVPLRIPSFRFLPKQEKVCYTEKSVMRDWQNLYNEIQWGNGGVL